MIFFLLPPYEKVLNYFLFVKIRHNLFIPLVKLHEYQIIKVPNMLCPNPKCMPRVSIHVAHIYLRVWCSAGWRAGRPHGGRGGALRGVVDCVSHGPEPAQDRDRATCRMFMATRRRDTHTYTYTGTYVCVCVCVCVPSTARIKSRQRRSVDRDWGF